MINFNSLSSVETYLIKSRSILEEDVTDSLIEYYIEGYRDSMNGNLVNEHCSKVDLITSLEEFAYVIGYKVGTLDYKIGHCNDCNASFSEGHKKAIKITLMAFYLDESVSELNSWLMIV